MEKYPKKVSLVKGTQRYENVRGALDLIKSELYTIREKRRILIKPNLTAVKNEFANTDVKAVEATIDFLLDNFPELHNSHFTILEGSGSAYYEKKIQERSLRNLVTLN